MIFKAAVLLKKNTIKILELKKPTLKPHQVFVKIIYSSICHTQLQEIKGTRGVDKFLPHCLGHEGVGKIVDQHKSVKKFKRNDIVCLSWIKGSGRDSGGVTYEEKNGKKINGGPVNTFSEYSVISENRLYKLKKTINLKTKVLFGCALSTAFNALNNISLKNSKTICIIGSGGLGLSTVIIAKSLGYKKIIVIDKIKKKLNIAKKFGATHTLDSLMKINFKNQIDVTVECTGNIDVLKNSILIPKKFGGKLIFIGNYPNNSKVLLNPWVVIQGVTLLGAWNDLKPFDSSFMKLEKLIKNKKLDLFFGNKIYKLNHIGQAIRDFENGKVIRPLIQL